MNKPALLSARMRTRFARILAVSLWASASSSAHAGGTRTFSVSDYESLDRGETDGAAIESTGRVSVGYLPQHGDVEAATAFTCVPDGKSMLIGTADSAAIMRVFPNLSKKAGNKTKPKKSGQGAKVVEKTATLRVEKVADFEGVLVSAMAKLPSGDTVAAILPGGKLVRVSAKGKVAPFAELDAQQVWALRVHNNKLWAATGPSGKLFRMPVSGKSADKPEVVLDIDDKDLLALAVVGDDIVVGTSPRANLYRVTDDIEGELLHSFSGDEVRALAVTDTALFAAVNKFNDRDLGSVEALSKTLRRKTLTGVDPTGVLSNERPPSADASIHVVDLGTKLDLERASEAPWERWLQRDDQYFTSVLRVGGDSVLVGSSTGGRVYRVSGPRTVATIADFDERQATSLCQLPKGPVFATTAHGASVYQLRAAVASQAKYRTEVQDAGHPSAWGAVRLRGSGALSLRARVGPTSTPDTRWSKWKSVPIAKAADGLRGTLAALPKRRFLELEVGLDQADAQLRSLEAFYAPENLAPLLSSIEVISPRFKKGDKSEPSSSMKIRWKADARDDDDLMYDVRIRPEGGSELEWVSLNEDDEPVTNAELSLDLATVPDGVYEVRVVASDEPSNGSGRAQTDQLVSEPFIIDRQRPTVATPSVRDARVVVSAQDSGGYIHDAAFSIDGGRFRPASAADGMFDSPSEEVVFELPADLKAGKHRVVIRVRDASGNIETVPVVIRR